MAFRKSRGSSLKDHQQQHDHDHHQPAQQSEPESDSNPGPNSKSDSTFLSPPTEADIATIAITDPSHPVFSVSPEKRDKMRAKGINPVLRAEIDEARKVKGMRAFWGKIGRGMVGGQGLALPTI